MNDAFVSIVANNDGSRENLLVRARMRDDIVRVFPNAEVFEDVSADYRYRAWIPREDVSRIIAERVGGIDYPNFKNSVKDHTRHRAYERVWDVLRRLQQ